MPAKGGAAGKAGDQYEALWTVDVALRVVTGVAEHVTYESLDPEVSRGVEFSVATASGEVEFWSLKRQTATASGWTLATLVRPDEHGRSILGDLAAHVERDARNIAVFASMSEAGDIRTAAAGDLLAEAPVGTDAEAAAAPFAGTVKNGSAVCRASGGWHVVEHASKALCLSRVLGGVLLAQL